MTEKEVISKGSWNVTGYENGLTDVRCLMKNTTPEKLRDFVAVLTQAIAAAELASVERAE